jgi:hypothetical protein
VPYSWKIDYSDWPDIESFLCSKDVMLLQQLIAYSKSGVFSAGLAASIQNHH